jgi:hypothetical protein
VDFTEAPLVTSAFRIHVDRLTLPSRPTGSIGGRIWISINGRAFPEEGSYDSVLVVLGWWAEAILNARRTGEPAELLFMEGPFEIRLMHRSGDDTLALTALRRVTTGVTPVFQAQAQQHEIEED